MKRARPWVREEEDASLSDQPPIMHLKEKRREAPVLLSSFRKEYDCSMKTQFLGMTYELWPPEAVCVKLAKTPVASVGDEVLVAYLGLNNAVKAVPASYSS